MGSCPQAGAGELVRVAREVREVIGDDHVGAACPGCCHHVPVVWVWQLNGRDEWFPASHERIGERRFHLPEDG